MHGPAGGNIKAALDNRDKETRVIVRDSGIGTPGSDASARFRTLFRADPSRTKVEGSGLGLAIAKWIADIHHAAICVESEEGRGTTFRVVFPKPADRRSHVQKTACIPQKSWFRRARHPDAEWNQQPTDSRNEFLVTRSSF